MSFKGSDDGEEGVVFPEASNGVFVNGVEIGKGTAVELSVGDKISLVCGNEDGSCGIGNRIGFVVQRIVFERGFREGCDDDVDYDVEIDGLTCSGHSQGNRNKRVLAIRANGLRSNVSRCERVVERARFILDRCRDILLSDDPVSCILRAVSDIQCGLKSDRDAEVQSNCNNPQRMNFPMEDRSSSVVQLSSFAVCESKGMAVEAESDNLRHHVCENGNVGVACVEDVADKNPDVLLFNSVGKEDIPSDGNKKEKHGGNFHPSPGKNFYLNRLEFLDHGSSGLHHSISLPELLYPVQSISRMFIATFTRDIKWCDYLNLSNVYIFPFMVVFFLFSHHFVS